MITCHLEPASPPPEGESKYPNKTMSYRPQKIGGNVLCMEESTRCLKQLSSAFTASATANK